jgi:RNA recognition motif-containing protein
VTVFIQNIPEKTTETDIRNFVNPALHIFRFIRTGKILKIEIFDSFNKATGEIQYHGVVYVDSEKTGQRAISKLHTQHFKNRAVTVRKYFDRSWHNDPRNNYKVLDEIKNRRVSDRRHHSYSAVDLSLQNFSTEKISTQLDGCTLFEWVVETKNEVEDRVNFSNLQKLLAKQGIAVRIYDNSLIFTPSSNSMASLITQMTNAFTTQI